MYEHSRSICPLQFKIETAQLANASLTFKT